jgi:hypothetical protein
MVFQMLLCDECYEIVYKRRTDQPLFKVFSEGTIMFIIVFTTARLWSLS